MIRGAGREPFERDAFYERVVRDADGQVLRANRHDFAKREEKDSLKVGKKNPEFVSPARRSRRRNRLELKGKGRAGGQEPEGRPGPPVRAGYSGLTAARNLCAGPRPPPRCT